MSTAHFADAIALLVKQPRSNGDLWRAMGQAQDNGRASRYLRALHDEGLVYVQAWRMTGAGWVAVWAWQPSVAHFPDAVKPTEETLA